MKINPLDRIVKTLGVAGSVYAPPVLVVFGSVGKLTQGGSGFMSETFYTMGPMEGECMTMNTMRSLC